MITRRQLIATGAAAASFRTAAAQNGIELRLQTRDGDGQVHTATERVDPRRIAVICVDAWHYHWCRTWRTRAGSLIPRFNYSFDAARKLGMTFLFSPTNAMRDLNESPQRLKTLNLAASPLPPLKNLPDPYPGAIRFGMCECGLGDDCYYTNNVNNQHPDLTMTGDDYIALTQQEAYNVLKHHGITHIIYTGFATNMCMWGKPTGMKYMRQFGFRCMVARELTEAITRYAEESFNPTQGTLAVIETIERELAPTINMEETLRRAAVWQGDPVLDYVHMAPWSRFFGSPVFALPIQVELTCRHQPGAAIRYTVDGTEPGPSSQRYAAPIKIKESCTVKAAAFRDDRRVTNISIANYWKFPTTPPPPDIYVSDLEPLRQWNGEIRPHSYAVPKRAVLNRSVDGHVLSNRDCKFAKGIGVQAPNEMLFRVDARYKRFVALVGVDDECMKWDNPDGLAQWPQWSRPIKGPTSYRLSQVVFSVKVDGKTIATTPALFDGDKVWGIDVRLPDGASQIALRVDDVESRITDPHGHGDWLNAGFVTT